MQISTPAQMLKQTVAALDMCRRNVSDTKLKASGFVQESLWLFIHVLFQYKALQLQA